MTAFDEAFTLLKVEHAFDLMEGHFLQKGKMDEAMELQAMREFVNVNAESADPAKRQAAEEMLRQLTELMSKRRPDPVQLPPAPVGEGGIPTASVEHPAVEKAFDFLKKNVIGIQEAGFRNMPIQYSMPPSVASMSQRPLVPEMTTQTSPAPGIFSRFRQPVSTQVPTGDMVMGGPQTMNVQENPQNPMAGFGAGHPDASASGLGGQMMSAPGAAVERMPRPAPFATHIPPPQSFAGQGYTLDEAGELQRPANPHSRGSPSFARFEQQLQKPVGEDEYAGRQRANPKFKQTGAADQFTEFERTADPRGKY